MLDGDLSDAVTNHGDLSTLAEDTETQTKRREQVSTDFSCAVDMNMHRVLIIATRIACLILKGMPVIWCASDVRPFRFCVARAQKYFLNLSKTRT